MEKESVRLTDYTTGGGCGCKIAPGELNGLLDGLRTNNEFGLLVGNQDGDDAAVYEFDNDNCLISTTDFFTPIVDDAFDFGRIAAANAISDIYAMGGKPLMAISILGWPSEKIPVELAKEVIKGASEVCTQAGIAIGGGHSIKNPEPIFGLAVTGSVRKENVKRNNGAKVGDILILTKPIGSGILTSALKKGKLNEDHYKKLIEQLTALNSIGEKLGELPFVHAMTDVTGFGLLGHLTEMVSNPALAAVLRNSDVPLMEGTLEFSNQFVYPDNTMRNWKNYGESVSGVSGASLLTLCDPQTNGGLLLAVDPESIEKISGFFEKNNQFYAIIGNIIPMGTHKIVIE